MNKKVFQMKSSVSTGFIKITILFILIGIGCKDKINYPVEYESFYPLKVGNIWEYKSKLYDSTGT